MNKSKQNIEANVDQSNLMDNRKEQVVYSDKLADYSKIMNVGGVQDMHEIRRSCIKSLTAQAMVSGQQWYNKKLQMQIISHTANFECLILKICYHTFSFIITVHFVNQDSPSHQICEFFIGNFSNVYRASIFGKEMAIKCNCFSNKNFAKIFENTLSEYLIFLIASQLNIGPKMEKSLGFDLIVYKNCVQFCMEFCEQNYYKSKGDYNHLQQDLKEGLKNLHSLNIIHFDIKPQNICYSQRNKKYVFIDYGLHRVIKQQFGLKTFTTFRGSVTFVSQQMAQCFQKSDYRFIDLYYNDAYCLRESLQQMKKNMNSFFLQAHRPVAINFNKQVILYIYKGTLINNYFLSNVNDHMQGHIENELFFAKNETIKQAHHFLLRLGYIFPFRNKTYQHRFNSHQLDSKNNSDTNDYFILDQEKRFDAKKEVIDKMAIADLHLGKLILNGKIYVQQHNQLANIYYCRQLDNDIYYLHLSKCLKYIPRVRLAVKQLKDIEIKIILNYLQIHHPQSGNICNNQMLNICLEQWIDFAISRKTLDNISFTIISACFQIITILQQCEWNEFIHLIERIISMEGKVLRRIRVFLSLFFSLEWVNRRIISKYSYYQCMDHIYRKCKQYLNSLQPAGLDQQEIKIVGFTRLVMQSTIPFGLLMKLKSLFVFKIYLYHATTNDYYLALIQLYLYATYRILQKKQSISPEVQSQVYKDLIELMKFQETFFFEYFMQFSILIFFHNYWKQSTIIKHFDFNNPQCFYQYFNLRKEQLIQHMHFRQFLYYQLWPLLEQINISPSKSNKHHIFIIQRDKIYIELKKLYKKNIFLLKSMKQDAKRVFIINDCLQAMDEPYADYHQHNLAEQTLTVLQIIREIQRMHDIYTNEEIDNYYAQLQMKINESCCIECKNYALIYFNTYKAEKRCGISKQTLEAIFIGNFTYLLKTQQSASFIMKYLTQYLYIVGHNHQEFDKVPILKYDYIYLIFQTAKAYNSFYIYFFLIRNIKSRIKKIPIITQTLTHFWNNNLTLYFQFLELIFNFMDQQQKIGLIDHDFHLQASAFMLDKKIYDKDIFFFKNFQFCSSKLKDKSSRSLALFFYGLISLHPIKFKLKQIFLIYLWKYVPKQQYPSYHLSNQFLKNMFIDRKKIIKKKVYFLVKMSLKTQTPKQLSLKNCLPPVKVDRRWGKSSQIHQKTMISKWKAYYQKNQQHGEIHQHIVISKETKEIDLINDHFQLEERILREKLITFVIQKKTKTIDLINDNL